MRTLLLLLLALALPACDSTGSDAGGLTLAIVLTEADAVAGTGRVTLDAAPAATASVTGSFALSAPGGGPVAPLARTSGTVNGTIDAGGAITLVLYDPDVSDTGIELRATYAAGGFSGLWGNQTIAGFQERGTFTATAE